MDQRPRQSGPRRADGLGKSWLASALGDKACRDNRSVLYQRAPRLFEDLALARGDGRHPRLLRNLGRADLLILMIGGLSRSTPPRDMISWKSSKSAMDAAHRDHLPASGGPFARIIGDPTYADAILDRLIHNAHRIKLAGESLRPTRAKQSRKA